MLGSPCGLLGRLVVVVVLVSVVVAVFGDLNYAGTVYFSSTSCELLLTDGFPPRHKIQQRSLCLEELGAQLLGGSFPKIT